MSSGDFTPVRKVERIVALLDRDDLTSAQKCVGVKLIAEADKAGVAEVRTPELLRAASARDRETVFRATKALKVADIMKASGTGQSGRFSVLPIAIVEAVVDAFEATRTGRHEPDRLEIETGRVEPVWIATSEPVGLNPTGRHEPDRSARACATKALPSEVVISKVDSPPTPSHVQPVNDWRGAFGADDGGVEFFDGKLRLVNGTLAFWLQRFDGDAAALDLALIEAAGSLQRGGNAGLKLQVERKLAGIARDRLDKDRRYAAAVERNARGGQRSEGDAQRRMRIISQITGGQS